MRLILLRHGETIWNTQKRLQGHDDSPLSERGVAQARAIAATLRRLAPPRAVVSDLGRTRQTARLVGFESAVSEPRLRELDMGEWTGCAKDELMASRPGDYAAWRAGHLTPAGGESWAEFTTRIRNGLLDWVGRGEGDLLAIVHSGVVRAACNVFLGLLPGQILPVTPGTLTIFDFAGGNPAAPRLEAYNVGPSTPDIDAAD
jgi:probable phosphoglycerate mutase